MEQTSQETIRQEQAIWEEFFASTGWVLFLRRFSPRLEGTVGEYDATETLRTLGQIQGQRQVLREVVELEGILEDEYADALAQAEGQDDVVDADWRG